MSSILYQRLLLITKLIAQSHPNEIIAPLRDVVVVVVSRTIVRNQNDRSRKRNEVRKTWESEEEQERTRRNGNPEQIDEAVKQPATAGCVCCACVRVLRMMHVCCVCVCVCTCRAQIFNEYERLDERRR